MGAPPSLKPGRDNHPGAKELSVESTSRTVIRLRCEPGWSVVTAEGPLEQVHRGHFLTCLTVGLRTRRRLVVDVRRVSFLGRAAVDAIVRVQAEAARAGKTLTLVTEDPWDESSMRVGRGPLP